MVNIYNEPIVLEEALNVKLKLDAIAQILSEYVESAETYLDLGCSDGSITK